MYVLPNEFNSLESNAFDAQFFALHFFPYSAGFVSGIYFHLSQLSTMEYRKTIVRTSSDFINAVQCEGNGTVQSSCDLCVNRFGKLLLVHVMLKT